VRSAVRGALIAALVFGAATATASAHTVTVPCTAGGGYYGTDGTPFD
jgi:hypothetical protein